MGDTRFLQLQRLRLLVTKPRQERGIFYGSAPTAAKPPGSALPAQGKHPASVDD